MTGLTIAQGRSLIRIIEGWDNGQHVTRPGIPTKTRAALFDAGLITIGTMVYPDALHPTDDGRAAAAKILGRLKRDPNSVHEHGSYEWARAREQEALDAQARHLADTAPGTHPAGDDLIGADIPTQDQLARAERAAAAHLEVVPDPEPSRRTPWDFGDPCPHCGHRAALHAGPGAEACTPGTCLDNPGCACPGWHPELVGTPQIPGQLTLFGGAA